MIKGKFLKRINKLIEAMKTEAAGNMLNMFTWAHSPAGAKGPREAFAAGGHCGTTVCMAGLAAVIDKRYFSFRPVSARAGGVEGYDILSKESSASSAFAGWLDISVEDATVLTDPCSDIWEGFEGTDTAHAVRVLGLYRDGGMEKVRLGL